LEQRNPYAPPKAPLVHEDRQPRLPVEEDVIEYGGFWRRFGALFLDGLILAPINIGVFASLAYTRNAYLYYFVPSLLIFFVYHVYLVRRFGGTPGKRIARMRITMTNGNPVTLRAAVVRYLPAFVLTALGSLALVATTLNFDDAEFKSLGFIEKMTMLEAREPAWSSVVDGLSLLWYVAGAVALIANARKRALHDFIARTVVIRED
jgi:uncharacterized RDD family membrane protein YckC